MKIVKVSETKIQSTSQMVDFRQIYNSDNVKLIYIDLKPCEFVRPYKRPVNGFLYVLEGTVEITIGTNKKLIGKDSIVETAKKDSYFLTNKTNKSVRVLLVEFVDKNGTQP